MKTGGFYNKASELLNKGYYIIDIPIGGKMPVRKEWPKIRMSKDDIDAINTQKYDPGVGIITGQVNESGYSIIAIDIDIRVGETVEQVIQIFNDIVGISPVRIGNPPKSLMIYKYKGERKKQVTGADNEHNRIEILGTGQQFVAYHTHPDTNKEYWWDREIPSIDELIEINDDQIDECISFWYSICPEAKTEKKVRIDSDGNEHYVGKSIPEMVIDILAGDNLHDSIVGISQQWSYDGIADEVIIRDLKAYMNKSKDKGSDRWLSRYNDIERIVQGAREKEPEVDISDIDINDGENVIEVPWPPGLLGELCMDAYNMAPYQYREMAIVSGVGLIAGLAGRKFNVSKQGLNVYLTLLMKSGMGKDFIGKWIRHTLKSLNPMTGDASSFCGPGRFTGPVAIAKSLMNARSQVCVFTEAGLLLQSQSGDTNGLCRALLSYYSCSGEHDESVKEIYSKDENNIPTILAPALSIISEATEATLFQAFQARDSIGTGELARQSVFRIAYARPDFNFDFANHELSQPVKDKLDHLHKMCSAVQAENKPSSHHLVPLNEYIRDDMLAFNRKMNHIFNNDSDPVRSIMASRAWLKAMKFAGIATVFNRMDVNICEQEWNWGKQMVEYELSTVDNVFAGGGLGNITEDLAKRLVAPCIVKIIRGEYKDRKQQSDTHDAKRGIFPRSALVKSLKNNRELNNYSDDVSQRSAPVSGLEKVIRHMISMGYIETIDWGRAPSDKGTTRHSGKYRITDFFRSIFDM